MKICDIDNGFEVRTNRNKLSRKYLVHDSIAIVTIIRDKPAKFVFAENHENALTAICNVRIMEECADVSSW